MYTCYEDRESYLGILLGYTIDMFHSRRINLSVAVTNDDTSRVIKTLNISRHVGWMVSKCDD